MSQPPPPVPPADDEPLQFDTAEPAAAAGGGAAPAAGLACVGCGQQITGAYYTAGDKVVCPRCREQYVASMTGGSGFWRLAKATALGLFAGLVGAAVWYAVRRATGYEIGLIAIVVGLMVGGAVKVGSSRRGGRGYQVLAVLLTYVSICANYMPDIFMAFRDRAMEEDRLVVDADGSGATGRSPATQTSATQTSATRRATLTDPAEATGEDAGDARAPGVAGDGRDTPTTTPAAGSGEGEEKLRGGRLVLGVIILVLLVFVFSLAAPFLGGAGNIIGLLIIAFALWEAWKINARQALDLSGPYALGGGGSGASPPPPPFPPAPPAGAA